MTRCDAPNKFDERNGFDQPDFLTTRQPGTATAGLRTVPVRSGLSGVKTLEFSGPPRPSDVLRAGTARAPDGTYNFEMHRVSREWRRSPLKSSLPRPWLPGQSSILKIPRLSRWKSPRQ